MKSKTAVLIITGAWHVPWHYQKLTHLLQASGVRVICKTLPTNNNVVPADSTLHDDVKFIKSIVADEAAKGTRLTVIGHSWGGLVSQDSLAEFAVQPGSDRGGVVSIIAMCAFIPFEGDSIAGIWGGTLSPRLVPQPDGTVAWDDPINCLYNDISAEDAKEANDMRVAFAFKHLLTPITCEKVAWRVIPLTYIFCEYDQAIPLALQEKMVRLVEAEGIHVDKYKLPVAHSPFINAPDKIADIIVKVMASH